ncbi:aldose 1-epimerase family protein [Rhodococcus sp. D2-41]|uniref:Aldose 1-epimerase family protein n=1 Tax=Speluncibacter jeojiensis TaxID=2710754 RepID=A0A9X4RD05_9ACTN|nr:aldose 1-epimerase family protein [Rhodococcus sp. D2-41]MDG3010406.1 aldose 1-epimerase family protein [Rhodococcus sp. D2-41]MDG3014153.1 aldose 1-epimerase family protein [Corynebacteriales bacterium D3-21]
MTVVPSGHQYEISHGDQRATIVEVGGGIRDYAVGTRDVLHPYALDAVCDGAHGAPLIPWPNRIADGRYRFDGVEHQLALTEPATGNAIHGLLRWRNWAAVEHVEHSVTMTTALNPMTGYPFLLEVSATYTLDDGGLTVRTTATNRGERTCPYAHGQHPYLSPGRGAIDACLLQITAGARITTDPDRGLPTGTTTVAESDHDFRRSRRLGATALDDGFTDLARDDDGRAWVRLTGGDGRTAAVWVDESFPVLQVYTAHTLADGRRRAGLAAEPMTAPANAFATGDRLIRLEPGESATTTWGCLLTG